MRKQTLIYTVLLISFFANAQHNILVNNPGNVMYGNTLSAVQSINFDNTYSKFLINGNFSWETFMFAFHPQVSISYYENADL